MAVQYAYRLGVSAMTDSSPEGVSLQDRYSAILQFQHTWAGSAFSPRIQDPQEGLRYLAQSNGVFVYAVENSHTLALKLHRPGNARTGLPELTFMCMAWKSLLEPTDLSGARYTVDLSQDLLVITLPGDARNEHRHHFISISSDCYPHPLAASSLLRTVCSTQRVGTDTYPKDADRLEFHSDLVAWGNYQATWHGDDDHYWQISMEVQVMNWKTGVVVWRYQTRQACSYHLIDRRHILVTKQDGIDVFSFDPDRGAPKPPSYTKPQAHLLRLCLPRLGLGVQQPERFNSFLHIPRTHRDDRPLFRPDPSHSLLAVRMDDILSATDKGRQVIRQSMVFLVSLATIRSYLARRETGWWRRSRAIVPWDNWGPTGARVVTAENTTAHKLSLAVHGSRCVLSIPTPVVFSPIEKMVVIDAHPYAQQCGSGVTRQTLQPEDRTVPPAPVVDSSDVRSSEIFLPYQRQVKGFMKKKTIVLEGRFPCRMETYLSPRKAEYRGNHTVLTGEEVVVVRTREA
ncbi:hypothetical protein L227DRAFT_617115 [Lentinus tigrinus ALCF2SS1-6]|uniref:Uncharacterized protein n=1 Tax=Lentinus tigrinus ALCF2SS1-6 TaxID=1328759 RepID=A0A5C2RP07_9APHY|nr:hypothetical protein L227DRAFT_617115 [Lentinus tigrinus ALCF2SS1-6]